MVSFVVTVTDTERIFGDCDLGRETVVSQVIQESGDFCD